MAATPVPDGFDAPGSKLLNLCPLSPFSTIDPNYFMLTTGETVTYNDSFTGVYKGDNIVKHLLAGGKTWKAYAEQLPSVGYTGGDRQSYVRRHNPFVYFDDVENSPVQRLNIVPLPQLFNDLNSNSLPNSSFQTCLMTPTRPAWRKLTHG